MLFNNIIGQEETKRNLIRTARDGRISHAQLFLGPEGSGNLAMAVAYAQYISCLNKTEMDSCGQCPSCIKFEKLVHPDLHLVFPLALSKEVRTSDNLVDKWREEFISNPYMNLFDWLEVMETENKQPTIGVEESSQVLQKLSLTAYESEYKIMIIWLAERMNIQAANKLLKILEEPPDKTVFLLVAENEENMLKTILSRTQLVKIKRLQDEDITAALIVQKGIDAEKASWVAKVADGSYRQALQLSEDEGGVKNNFESFTEWMRQCFKLNNTQLLEIISKISGWGRESQKGFLVYSLSMIRACMLLNYGDPKLVRLDNEEMEFAKKFAPFINGANCIPFADELNKACLEIERNANPKILFTDLSFKVNALLALAKKKA